MTFHTFYCWHCQRPKSSLHYSHLVCKRFPLIKLSGRNTLPSFRISVLSDSRIKQKNLRALLPNFSGSLSYRATHSSPAFFRRTVYQLRTSPLTLATNPKRFLRKIDDIYFNNCAICIVAQCI